jgi:hypothetical protein
LLRCHLQLLLLWRVPHQPLTSRQALLLPAQQQQPYLSNVHLLLYCLTQLLGLLLLVMYQVALLLLLLLLLLLALLLLLLLLLLVVVVVNPLQPN